jgi:cytochrome c
VLLTVLACILPLHAAADDTTGQKIFQAKCAGCHGRQGEGTPKHKRRLEGDKSVSQLADLVAKTMPEDDPGSLSSGEAAAVAAYVHDTFYSPIARERNRPARVELARLTVRQYHLAVADLIGSFRPEIKWERTWIARPVF